jgi:hypothetical protein
VENNKKERKKVVRRFAFKKVVRKGVVGCRIGFYTMVDFVKATFHELKI